MKILLLLIFSTLLTFSQTTENKNIDSKILNKKKEIQIFLPNNYEHSKKKYPTLYVLDGQTYFYYGEVSNKHSIGVIKHQNLLLWA